MVSAIIPTPVDFIKTVFVDGPLLLSHSFETGQIWILGLFLSLVLGIGLSILMVETPLISKFLIWPLKVLQIVPSVVFVPLFILMFGFGFMGKVCVVMSTCAFPLVSVLYPALQNARSKYKLLRKILDLSTYDSYKHIYLWACLRDFFSSLRLCVTYSWGSAITAELMGSEAGLGVYMARSLAALQPEKVWAMALLTAFLVLFFLKLISQIEKRCLYWQDHHH